MTLFWDPHWCFATGIIAATVGSLFRRDRVKYAIAAFIGGLIFVVTLIYGAIWLFLEVDPDWMVNYFFVPDLSALGWAALYPLHYALAFGITLWLVSINKDRWWMLGFAVWWIIFTLLLAPRFYLVYGTTGTPEWFWEVTRTTDNFFFLPVPPGTSLGPFFMFLFIGSIALHTGLVIYGVFLAQRKKGCARPDVVRNNPYCYAPPRDSY